MERYPGRYALIQFGPNPERQEFLNVGVVLLTREPQHVGIRLASMPSRIQRAFGRETKELYDHLREAFETRLRNELVGKRWSESAFAEFSSRRANGFRVSPLMPISVTDPSRDLQELFEEVVPGAVPRVTEPRIRKRLKAAFSKFGVAHLLDDPPPIELPELGVKVDVPFGYQNGVYNLIDGLHLSPEPGNSLREAGKRAIEGSLIWKHFEHADIRRQLVVVGDFGKQSDGFFAEIEAQMRRANVKIFELNAIGPLVDDIEKNARLRPHA